MRLPWTSRRQYQRAATRRKRGAPLRVRRLERRRVLDASIADIVLAPADIDGSTLPYDANEGTQVTATAVASGTGTLSYEWTLFKLAAPIDSGTGPNFTFTLPDNGNYSVTLTVTDDVNSISRTEGMIVHNVRPVLVVANDQEVNEGTPLNLLPLAGFIDDGIEDTHTATVNWGDGSPLATPTIFEANGSGSILASHTYDDDGLYEVIVTVTDDEGLSDTKSFFVTVKNVAPTAVFENSGPVVEGSSAFVSFSGQFDPSSADTAAAFRYAYDLDNDGTFEIGGDTYATATTSDSQVVSAALLAEGPSMHTVRARIFDKNDQYTEYTTTIVVNNDPPELINIAVTDNSIDEGETAEISMTIEDSGAFDVFEVDVDWKDGGPVDTIAGLGMANASGTIGGTTYEWDGQARKLTVRHQYLDDNPSMTMSDDYAVALTVRDDDLGSTGPYSAIVTVNNVRPVLTVAADQLVLEGTSLNLAPLASFIDDGVQDTHTATVDWGDGSPLATPTIFAANGSGSILASHTYADDGMYEVTVTVTDDDGNSDTQSFFVTVENAPPMLAVTPSPTDILEGGVVSFNATFSDPGFDNPLNPGTEKEESFTYDIDWGDGRDAIFGMAVADTNGAPGVDSTGMFSGSHTYADDGTYTVTVTLHDDDGGMHFQTFQVMVTNVAPTLTGTSNLVRNEGQAFTLDDLGVGLEDPGFDNPLNPTTPSLGDPLQETFTSFTINWGDGTALTPVTIDSRVSGAPGEMTTANFTHAAHTYADDGVYTVTIRLADDNMSGNFTTGVAGIDFVDRTFTITVNNVLPTLNLAVGNQTVNESDDLVLPVMVTFSDPGFDNPLNPNAATPPSITDPLSESFRYFLDWGDGRDQIGSLGVADLNGAPGTHSSGMFGGSHNYADNGIYTVTIRLADDNMSGNFASGVAGVDYVEQIFTVTVNNLGPAFIPQANGASFQGDEVNKDGITTIRVAMNDFGYDNPLNASAANGGEQVEMFNHVVQWGDGTVDAIHPYTSPGVFTVTVTMTPAGGAAQEFTFANFNSTNPVLTLVSSQQINDPGVVPQIVTYVVNWGDGHVETFQLSLLNPGPPVATNGLTTLVTSTRASGNATTLTTGTAEVQHLYLGPPNPLNPTADIIVTLSVYDDDGASVSDFIAIGNPGIATINVAIDTTPDVPRLDLSAPPMVEVFVPDPGGLAQVLQVPDLRSGGGEVAATAERYLELRIVYPDGTESEGYRIKDEALADLRAFFKTLPDGRYAIYLIRTENQSARLVIEVDVRRGRVIDVSDDSEGTRDRPPTEEERPGADVVPLDQNPALEAVPSKEARQGDLEIRRHGQQVLIEGDEREGVSLSTALSASLPAAAIAAGPWSRRVDEALSVADDTAWRRLRRAGRSGKALRRPLFRTDSAQRATANVDYNRT